MIIPVNLGSRSYDIVVERGCLKKAGKELDLDRKVLIVTDTGVPALYAETIAKASADPTVVTVPMGEGSKSLPVLESLLLTMLEKGFSRKDCVVAVGGGVVGDLSGFAAATYMRGIDFYNVPTTLLSQIDSSIGGKTAVNLGGIKNIVGAFHQPQKVLIDPDVLSTLPPRQIASGLAEAIKMSLTSDEALFSLLETENIAENLDTVIVRSLLIKKHVVEEDETEKGLRKILNFGHTVGHGIESEEELNGLYHGECVALGMLPMCHEALRPRLVAVLKKAGLPTSLAFDEKTVLEAMMHDKKSDKSSVSVIKVDKPGTFRMENADKDDLTQALRILKQL